MVAPTSRESIHTRLSQVATGSSSSSSARQRPSDTEPPAAGPPSPSASRSASSALRNLSNLIATITIEDINNAERCGGGGFGDVYLLTHREIGKLALKRVRTFGTKEQVGSQIRRSTREAETWQRLAHPNVLPFLDVLERSNDVYMISPFIENGSLSDYARRHPDVDRTRLIQEAAAGIAYLHRVGIVHGDIKGANILVSDDVRALLCDFGLARQLQNDTSTEMQGIGTIRWQSSELLLFGGGKTFKSDVWAFAMTIYEILSGNIPFYEFESTPPVIVAIVVHKQRPPREPTLSPTGTSYTSLWDVAQDCWHEDPDQRPDIQEAYDRLILGGFRSLSLSQSLSDQRPSSIGSDDQGLSHSPISSRVGFNPVGDESVPEQSGPIQAIESTSEKAQLSQREPPTSVISPGLGRANHPPPEPVPQQPQVTISGVLGVGWALVRLLAGKSDPDWD